MSFRAYLYDLLVEEHVITEEELDVDSYTAEDLLECTELDEEDLLNYKRQFVELCKREGVNADFDVDDMPA